jgi:hypothetical protein
MRSGAGGFRRETGELTLGNESGSGEAFEQFADIAEHHRGFDVILLTDCLDHGSQRVGPVAELPNDAAYFIEGEVLPAVDIEEHRLALDLLHDHSLPPPEDGGLI